MLQATAEMLQKARSDGYAVGAFNIYNMEGALAVLQTAERLQSPVILQLLPRALQICGNPLIAFCRAAAHNTHIPVAVHLDHCPDENIIKNAIAGGISSVMADGSHLPLAENIAFSRRIAALAKTVNVGVEGELGLLSGEEDGLVTLEAQAKMTVPEEAARFVEETGVDALAVCIGNVHGKYVKPPQLDFERLGALAEKITVPLVLHGTSGLPDDMIKKSISYGVAKFNVNTEVRSTYVRAMKRFSSRQGIELVQLMEGCIEAMQKPIEQKILLFGSNGRT
ncbi:MAG: class II fructose-bisphosphate aldolase [Desulfopila sp.]|jgi:tagatose 1,6-diphosphate aldolase GatY/KbaY|nr:class II fructose-bisphosphate aldolase [Desulfopila sp.]